MKYALLIADGLGDRPLPELNGLTPVAAAHTPHLDSLARNGTMGLVRTVPEGLPPGSDVAILSLLGYDPRALIGGRGPLEAASRRLPFGPGDLVFRLNLVTVEETGGRLMLRDHSAGNISSPEAEEILADLASSLPLESGQRLHPGVGYRHILIWPDPAPETLPSFPPHDYRDQDAAALWADPAARELAALALASRPLLENHPVNVRRRARGLPPANFLWPWGQGRRPALETFGERFGLGGAAVSAVDLVKGLGVLTGLETPEIPGATGWVDTDYEGKVEAALEALSRLDLAVVHLEAPDEASHQGDLALKMKAIADFDARIVGPILKALPAFGDYRVLAACDHLTPLALKTHAADPVPFVIHGRSQPPGAGRAFSEAEAAAGPMVASGPLLGRLFFGPENNGEK